MGFAFGAAPSTFQPIACIICAEGSSAVIGRITLLPFAFAWMIVFRLLLGFRMSDASKALPLTFRVDPKVPLMPIADDSSGARWREALGRKPLSVANKPSEPIVWLNDALLCIEWILVTECTLTLVQICAHSVCFTMRGDDTTLCMHSSSDGKNDHTHHCPESYLTICELIVKEDFLTTLMKIRMAISGGTLGPSKPIWKAKARWESRRNSDTIP